jgi:hypothetical protein
MLNPKDLTSVVRCLRNNHTVFKELEVSIVDLMVANAVLLATRSGYLIFRPKDMQEYMCMFSIALEWR